MDAERFWSIIEVGGRETQKDPQRQLEAIGQALTELSPDELIECHRLFNRAMDDAHTWDLWGAAYLIPSYGKRCITMRNSKGPQRRREDSEPMKSNLPALLVVSPFFASLLCVSAALCVPA